MLVMKRREGESILVGEDIEIRILSLGRSTIKLGIIAPRDVVITRQEVKLIREANLAAAETDAAADLPALARSVLRRLTSVTSHNSISAEPASDGDSFQ
jgi:carbon storage regulator